MVNIKVLGSGCTNCKRVEAVAQQAVSELGLDAVVEKVTDPVAIHAYPIMSTPGLVVNEQLVCAGRIPNLSEVMDWVKSANQ